MAEEVLGGGGSGDGSTISSNSPFKVLWAELNLSVIQFKNENDISSNVSASYGVVNDGTGETIFTVDPTDQQIDVWDLSTAWDTSTASRNSGKSTSTSTNAGSARGMAFNGDGTKMFLADADDSNIEEYSLSTAYDPSSKSHNNSFDISANVTTPSGVVFNSDGTTMYVTEGTNIEEYTLSTGYDTTTASHTSTHDYSSTQTGIQDIIFLDSGNMMLAVDDTDDDVTRYSLSTAYDVSTETEEETLDISGKFATGRGLVSDSNLQNMIITGDESDNGNAAISDYTVNIHGVDIYR